LLSVSTQPPTPGPFVDEARASSEFYSNKLLMQYRKDESAEGKTQVAWVTAWNTFLKELRAFIKTYHTTDLTWNAQVRNSSHTPPLRRYSLDFRQFVDSKVNHDVCVGR
jgi:hypothetical protein